MSSRRPQITTITFSRSSSKSRLRKESSLKRYHRRAHSPMRTRTCQRAWSSRVRTFSRSVKSHKIVLMLCNRLLTGMCQNQCSFLKVLIALNQLAPNKELVVSLLTSSRRLPLYQASSNKIRIPCRRSVLLQLGHLIRLLGLKIRISRHTINPLSSMV